MSGNFRPRLKIRTRLGLFFKYFFLTGLILGIVSLLLLLFNIVDNCFGFVLIRYTREPATLGLTAYSRGMLSADELTLLLEKHLTPGMLRKLTAEKPFLQRDREELNGLFEEQVLKPVVIKSWSLWESLFTQEAIYAYAAAQEEAGTLNFRSWLTPEFLVKQQSSVPEKSGIRTALLGSLWMILITLLIAFPMGIATAIYMEEYASDTRLNRIIQVNIYNLAGIPSIVYGLFGLAVFVRFLEPVTSGAVFGATAGTTAYGRTIFSAGLTLALLVLPIIIINTQEALRGVPASLRYASYGLGATRWQTIRHHVLPGCMDRILTGTILAVSRAIGETAPLVVIGASTFITFDPTSLFSKFTTLPIQIYQWTARPQGTFRNIAAAAILVLLVLLIALNTAAIVLRNRLAAKRSNV